MDNVSTQLLPTNDEIPENSENWCKRCKAPKESGKHQYHLKRDRERKKTPSGKASQERYKKSERGKASQERYKKSERGKASRKVAQERYKKSERGRQTRKDYEDALKAVNKCVKHPERDCLILGSGACEDCWWGGRARHNLGKWKFGNQLKELFIQQGFKCFYSGVILTIPYMNVDHKDPLARGGLKILSNACITTDEINQLKGRLTYSEFLAACRTRWEEHQAGNTAVDRGSILMVQIWNYQLTK